MSADDGGRRALSDPEDEAALRRLFQDCARRGNYDALTSPERVITRPIARLPELCEWLGAFDGPVVIAAAGPFERAASQLHRASLRRGMPFATLPDLPTWPPELVTQELLGLERPSQVRAGLIERSHPGTIGLPRLSLLPRPLRGDLARLLETGRLQRVGALRGGVDVDVRLIFKVEAMRELGGDDELCDSLAVSALKLVILPDDEPPRPS